MTNAVSRPNAADTSAAERRADRDHRRPGARGHRVGRDELASGTMIGTVDDRAGSKKPVAPTVTAVTT